MDKTIDLLIRQSLQQLAALESEVQRTWDDRNRLQSRKLATRIAGDVRKLLRLKMAVIRDAERAQSNNRVVASKETDGDSGRTG